MEKTTEKRITKAMYFEDIAAYLEGKNLPNSIELDQLTAFVTKERELIARKNSSGSKKSDADRAQDAIDESLVLDFLRVQSEPRSVTDIWRGIPEFSDKTTSKVTSIVGRLLKSDAIVKSVGKNKRSLYSIA